MYPRASIDNSRRVRELSHSLQCELMKSARNRMGKRLASCVGPWFAGSFDKDRGVARAATDGLSKFCDTEEKLTNVWRKCQGQILDYAKEAIKETPDTLSDARTTTKEDVEVKYHRVAGGSLSLVLNLLNRADLDALNAELDEFFAMKAVWSLAAAPDSFVRKTLYRLLQASLERVPHIAEVHVHNIGQILLSDPLRASQTNSAADLVRVLTSITERFPEVWGSKKSPLEKLRRFMELGSHGCSRDFWQDLDKLLTVLPLQNLSVSLAAGVLAALRTGVSRRDEPRDNVVYAWACYINTFERFMGAIAPTVPFVQENIYPLTRQYLHPTPELSSWTCSEPRLYPKAWDIVLRQTDCDLVQSVHAEWTELADKFVSRLSNSLPEVSADFMRSQEDVSAEGRRWFTISAAVLAYRQSESMSPAVERLKTIVTEASHKVIRGACEQLTKRNYKPYGAAATLKSALEKCPDLFRATNDDLLDALFPPDRPEELDNLLKSSSFEYLVSCLQSLARIPAVATQCKATLRALIDVVLRDGGNDLAPRLTLLLSDQPGSDIAQHHTALQEALVVLCTACASGSNNAWSLLDQSLSRDLLTPTSLHKLMGSVLEKLEHGVPGSALKSLELVLSKKPSLLENLQTQMTALTTLLALSEISDDTVAKTAMSLRVRIEEVKCTSDEGPMIKIIQSNLESASSLSLDVDTLVKQAHSCADSVVLEKLFPDSNKWRAELLILLSGVPDPALALTSSLGGAYHLVKRSNNERRLQPTRDRDGRSTPARMALYTSRLFASGMHLDSLPREFHTELLFLLYLTVELAADQLSVPVAHGLWRTDGQTAMDAMQEFVSSSRKMLNSFASSSSGWRDDVPEGSLIGGLIEIMIRQSREFTSMALYSAKALSTLLQAVTETHGFPSDVDTRFPVLQINKATSANVFPAVAVLAGFGIMLSPSKAVNHLCNNMVSQVAGAFPSLPSTLSSMVILNGCFSVYEPGTVPVDHRRLGISIKQMTSWTDVPDEMSAGLAAETCKGLQNIAPNVQKLYGPYWNQSVSYCLLLWHRAPQDSVAVRSPYLHASLKLLTTLETLENPNEDLRDVLEEKAMEISRGLISVLKMLGDGEDLPSPAQIVNGLFSRRAEKIPEEHLEDVRQLYSLMASESKDIQTAGFSLVCRRSRLMQEELSLDALLNNDDSARLPEELLSLLLDAPTLEAYPDDVLNRFPAAVRTYLLAWSVVFQTMGFSAHKLRNDYAEQLKTENHLPPLLTFMFDVLGHSAAHALNLDKAGFTSRHVRVYDIKLANAETAERGMQWLLVHLFYEVLKYVPGLFKAWFLDCRSKQTKIAVEAWTTRFFSPLIVADMLDAVMEWQDEKDDEEEPRLHVKVSRAAREIVASYEVDELEGAIAVRVPPSYPLETVTVEGVNRVAVSEKKWQSWLLSTQGSIVFANGSIIDGLGTFRRNVVGALKGQTECAICYSIVSSDKRMPDKRCSTCKNLFHRSCLYKWFQSSNQNSCPLCRNPIDYLGHVHY